MDRQRIVIIFLFVFSAMALLYGRAVIQNDGITYYALAHSLIHDRDFDLTNQAALFPDLRISLSPKTGRVASRYSCGFAFLYAPILLFAGLIPSLNTLKPYAQNAIFPFADSFGVFAGSLMFGSLSIFFAYKMLRSQGESMWPALLISFAVFCGTPLIFYTFTTPSFIHASDTFLFSAIFYLTIRKDPIRFGKVRVRNLLLGLLLGLSFLLRNINVSFIIPIVCGLLYLEREQGKKSMLITVLEIAAGGFPILLIQLSFNWSQYGSLMATGYTVPVAEEANDFLRMFLSFGRMGFHPSMGLFIWSPVTVLSICGLILGCVKRKPDSILATICVLFVIISICFFRIMWPGASFGNRYLTNLYIFWVLGLHEMIIALRKPAIIASTILVLWSFLLFNVYYVNFASSTSRKALSDSRNVTPIKVIETAAETYLNDNPRSNAVVFWYRSFGAAPYPSIHSLIWHADSRHRAKTLKRKAVS